MNEVAEKVRKRILITGAVQGVGFRPFVYRLAHDLHLTGWVENSTRGVILESEGDPGQLDEFIQRLRSDKPSAAVIQHLEDSDIEAHHNGDSFVIRKSSEHDEKTASIIPDLATCPECLKEIFDPDNRRYLYPFTNCTNCGPRYSIIEALPYDRAHTTMKVFAMCPECREEYENPLDRRFHAQPNACPECGPKMILWDRRGQEICLHHDAMLETVAALGEGKIVAVKGLGGFHLIVDASKDKAVRELRQRKHREEKPLAVMFPDLDAIKKVCEVFEREEALLVSPASPIVLVKKKRRIGELSEEIAPGNPTLGVFLPYTPIHHILHRLFKRPIVATSGNHSEEPICIDENEVVEYLGGIADLFLVHDRPIARHVDDSVVRVIAGKPTVLRRARGFAPSPVVVEGLPSHTLAVGAHLKNTVAMSSDDNVFIGQHIGDLENSASYRAFEEVIGHFQHLYEKPPEIIAHDKHPDYLSTRYAARQGAEVVPVQHHYAHVLSVMAENKISPPVLGVAWDGTGYGDDGTAWGGEFLTLDEKAYRRAAHLRTFPLPGGDLAAREPRRSAVGLLYELYGDKVFKMASPALWSSFTSEEKALLKQMLHRQVNCPRTSSVGRLFDAVASLLNFRQKCSFEGQAAMELEFLTDGIETSECYNIKIRDENDGEPFIWDWSSMIENILNDIDAGISKKIIAAKFHNTLAEVILKMAIRLGFKQIALSGGCFQNKYLTETAVKKLTRDGFQVFTHGEIPPNDGGISLGQMLAVKRHLENK